MTIDNKPYTRADLYPYLRFTPILDGIRKQIVSCVALDVKMDQNNISNTTNRIFRWIETGNYIFEIGHIKNQATKSIIESGKIPYSTVGKTINISSEYIIETSLDSYLNYSANKFFVDLNS
jgi:hypothetical protein